MSQQKSPRALLPATARVTAGASAGALVLMMAWAAPAHAGGPTPCPKGTDPASTIDNWKCQLDNIRKELEPKPTPTPSPTANDEPSGGATKDPAPAKKKERSRDRSGGGAGGSGGGGGGAPQDPPDVRPQNLPGSVEPIEPGGPPPAIPLPSPEVAPQGRTAPVPQTRLISPVAANESTPAVNPGLAALAAGAAGTVAALHLTVLGRRLRGDRRVPA